MTLKINGNKIICTRKKDHREYLWQRIKELRQEIIDDVLIGQKLNRMPIKSLKAKTDNYE